MAGACEGTVAVPMRVLYVAGAALVALLVLVLQLSALAAAAPSPRLPLAAHEGPAPTAAAAPRALPLAATPDELLVGSLLFNRPLRSGVGAACDNLKETERVEHAVLGHFTEGFENRAKLGPLLELITGPTGRGVGVELGVQFGQFSDLLLQKWPSATEYYMVDPWVQQQNYIDTANVESEEQSTRMAAAIAVARSHAPHVSVKLVRNFSFDAVRLFPDCFFDFVYVDAVHDYEGALVDMIDWWPKVRRGGLLAGHDHVDEVESSIFGVKTAAAHFGLAVHRQVWETREHHPSFFIIK